MPNKRKRTYAEAIFDLVMKNHPEFQVKPGKSNSKQANSKRWCRLKITNGREKSYDLILTRNTLILIDVVKEYCIMARHRIQKVEYQPEMELK